MAMDNRTKVIKMCYLADVRMPTEKAHGIQIMKTCEAFADVGINIKLFVPLILVLALAGLVNAAAPTITSTPSTTATPGIAYGYDVQATDPDVNDTLTYSLITSPTGMTINSNTGLISWTPNSLGDFDVVVRVSDGTLIDSETVVITTNSKN